jgi:hypothetical protein
LAKGYSKRAYNAFEAYLKVVREPMSTSINPAMRI